ncbi:MAG TPA: hypothetical protein VGJ15_13900 [Pirellulales bacterium]|jgi:hypothetical protein
MRIRLRNFTRELGERPNVRSVLWGAAVMVGGSLVMATVVGIAAVTGMLFQGASPQTIVATLPSSTALAVFVGIGGLLMNLAGGYVAATIAVGSPLRRAVETAALATIAQLALLPLWGDFDSLWATALSSALAFPLALLGAWLAMPVAQPAPATTNRRQ